MKSALIEVGRTYGGGPVAEKRTIKEIRMVDGKGDGMQVRFTTPSEPYGRWCSLGRFIGWAKTVEIDGVLLDKFGKPVAEAVSHG